MKLMYLHSNSLDTSSADMHQTVNMCNAFTNYVDEVVLSVPFSRIEPQILIANAKKFYNDIRFQIEFREIPVIERYGKYLGIKHINKHIIRTQPDLLYTRDPSSLHSCINSGLPIYFESHNSRIHQFNEGLNKYWCNYLLKVSKKDQFHLVTISNALKEFWINYGIDENKIIALHDGFDEDLFQDAIRQEDARKIIGLDLNKTYAIYTGSLFPDREIENILILAREVPEIDFLVVGGPENQKEYFERNSIKENIKNITFTGHIDHKLIPTYLFACNILLALWSRKVITINYCSPLKVFEYMASGKTIIAHAFPTIKEVLTHNENSILVNPDSISDLIDKVKFACNNTESNLGSKARLDAFSKHSWKIRASFIITHFNNLY